MKKYIIFLILLTSIVNYLYSFDKSKVTVETGNFYFLVGTEGNEKAIMYLRIEANLYGEEWRAYGSYYTKSQESGFDGSFDGENLKLAYGGEYDSDKGEYINQKYITGTLLLEGGTIGGSAGGITFRGKNNSKNVNLSLANAPVNSARIRGTGWEKRFIFNVRTLDNLSYDGRYANIVYLDENIIVIDSLWAGIGEGSSHGLFSEIYLINTGKQIEIKDFISNLNDRNLLALLRKKVLEYASNSDNDLYDYSNEIYYSFDNDLYDFIITPKDIIFYIGYWHANFESYEIYLI